MTDEFDVFVTIDGNLEYQQNLSGAAIAVVVLKAVNNMLETLLPLVSAVRAKLPELEVGEIVKFGDQ